MHNTWIMILNPKAGCGKAAKKLDYMKQIIDSKNINYKLIVTENAEHAITITENFIKKGYKRFVAVGGDGTLNEIINGIMSAGIKDDIEVGLIPIGGGNDFAKALNIPLDVERAIEYLERGNKRKVDIGKLQDKYFINSVGIGFDAEVAKYSQSGRFLLGLPRYFVSVLRAFRKKRSYKVTLDIDGHKLGREILMMTIGNGKYCGGGFMVTPDANPYDNKFDVCIVANMRLFSIVRLLPFAIKGTHVKSKNVEMMNAGSITIEAKEKLPIYYDGEILEFKRKKIKIDIIKDAINLITG